MKQLCNHPVKAFGCTTFVSMYIGGLLTTTSLPMAITAAVVPAYSLFLAMQYVFRSFGWA